MIEGSKLRPHLRRAWWRLLHLLCFCYFWPMYGYRAWGQHNIPDRGPVLLLANHQSHYDPVLVGLACHKRTFWAMARKTLFDVPVLGPLIRSLNAISVDQDASDIQSIRTCVDVLKRGQALVIFPEGERTLSGGIHGFEPGTMLLIKRANPTVVPVALDGSYHVWPRMRKFPRLTGRMGVIYGQPIEARTLLEMRSEEALEHLRSEVERLQGQLIERLGTRSQGRSSTWASNVLVRP